MSQTLQMPFWVLPILLFYRVSIGQATYVKTSAYDTYWHPSAMDSYIDGSLAVGVSLSQSAQVGTKVAKIDGMGNVLWSRRSNTISVSNIVATGDGGMAYVASMDGPQTGSNREVLVKLAADGGLDWYRYLFTNTPPFSQQCGLDEAVDGGMIVSAHDVVGGNRRMLCSRIGVDGAPIWAKGVSIHDASCDAYAVKSLADGTVAVGGMMEKSHGGTEAIVLKMNHEGVVEWAKSYAGFALTGLDAFPDGGLLLTGITSASEAVLIRTSGLGEVEWGCSLPLFSATQSGRQGATVTAEGDVMLAAVLPNGTAGLLKISTQGGLMWAKGYTNATMITSPPVIGPDGGVIMLITSRAGGFLSSKGLIIKTDREGLVSICEGADLCLSLHPFETVANEEQWIEEDVVFQQFGAVAVYYAFMSMDDVCDPLPSASPAFTVPDAICVGDSVLPIAENQTSADDWAWYFEGGQPSSSTQQSPPAVVFQDTGRYTLMQTIYLNYCADSFLTMIDVLPVPYVRLPPDTVVCNRTYHVDVRMEGVVQYEWSDGPTSPLREIQSGGAFEVRLANRGCESTGQFQVNFLHEEYPGAEIDLGNDAVICESQRLILDATVPYASSYMWENGIDSPSRTIYGGGIYHVDVQVGNCLLSDTIRVVQDDCKARVFMPNAFSPNRDGVNDFFAPFSNDAVLFQMLIYDRWGGLLHRSSLPTSKWDGTRNGTPLPEGVYVYVCLFMNLRTGHEFERAGEVHLFR